MYSVGAVYSTVYWGIFFFLTIASTMAFQFYKSFITVDHPRSAPLNLSSTGIAARMSGITPMKLLLNKSKELNCMVEENDNESLVKLLNLYEWIAGLTEFEQNGCSDPRPQRSNNLHRIPAALTARQD